MKSSVHGTTEVDLVPPTQKKMWRGHMTITPCTSVDNISNLKYVVMAKLLRQEQNVTYIVVSGEAMEMDRVMTDARRHMRHGGGRGAMQA